MQLATSLAVRRLFVLAAAITGFLLIRACSEPARRVIERGSTGCLGSGVIDTFAIAPDGAVTWTGYGHPERRFQLTPAELATLANAQQLSDDDDQPIEFHYWLRVDGGDDIFIRTSRGRAINALLEAATTRFETDAPSR